MDGRVMVVLRASIRRAVLRHAAVAVATAVLSCAVPALSVAADLPRFTSINVCTDQLLLALADPEQILGLSPYSRDPEHSFYVAAAARYTRLSGGAEDALMMMPDVVLSGSFTNRPTRQILQAEGVNVEEFPFAASIVDVEAQIRRMGDIVRHPDRAAAQVARIEEAIVRNRETVSKHPYRVLAVSRNGWVSGSGSLTNSLLEAVGLRDASTAFRFTSGGFATLEDIITVRPDLLLVTSAGDFAGDQGRAFLLHPALEALYPSSKRIVLPEQFTVCGGPMLADALDRLGEELERVSR
jgi:iron complex transport system substrate-binding protein